jgi:hypothetical protein
VKFGTADDPEYEEIVEEYVEKIFVSEEFQEPPVTDTTDTASAQGKPRCIPCIFYNHYIYTHVVHLHCRNVIYIYIYES